MIRKILNYIKNNTGDFNKSFFKVCIFLGMLLFTSRCSEKLLLGDLEYCKRVHNQVNMNKKIDHLLR